MLLLAVAALLAPPPDPLAAVRRQFGDPHLPAGCTAEVFDGPGLRLRQPPTVGVDPANPFGPDAGVPWVMWRVTGDFERAVRVRFVFDPAAGAAGVTETVTRADDTVEHVAVPTVVGGFVVDGAGAGRIDSWARLARRGRQRRLDKQAHVSAGNGGEGIGVGGGGDPLNPVWLTLKRTGGEVELGFGEDGQRPADWPRFAGRKVPMADAVDVRLFASGNLNQPFTVEFEHLRVTPLPAKK